MSEKSIVRMNAEKDPNYKPYCMRCSGLIRMQIVESFYWQCKCGAEHDERGPVRFGEDRHIICEDRTRAHALADEVTASCMQASSSAWEGWNARFKRLSSTERAVCWSRASEPGTKNIDMVKLVFRHWGPMTLEALKTSKL